MKNLIITQEIWQEGNMYTSYCPELDVASCGRTIEVEMDELRLDKQLVIFNELAIPLGVL